MTGILLLTIATPLVLAGLALFSDLRSKLLHTLPWASIPALILALTFSEEALIHLPYGLTGVLLGVDELRRIFLLAASVIWTLSAVYAIGYLRQDTRQWQFALCWLLTLCGNLGLILSFDALSFYSFFALMTFAGYGLVVFSATTDAFYAGRIYLIMAVIGEGLLLIGLLAAVFAAGVNPELSLLPSAIANSSAPAFISILILFGFGIKAGLPILHLWLPLAHPVAPVPASAVLSGVMIKAGLLGWMLFLPLGEISFTVLGQVTVGFGLLAAIGGAILGVCQYKAKTVLAYSSISQMGWMTLMLGLVLMQASLASVLIPLIALFALHHGLAKSALFLCSPMNGNQSWRWLWVLLPASALMGLPLSSGALLKTELKQSLHGLVVSWPIEVLSGLLTLASIGTCLLMLRYYRCLAVQQKVPLMHPLQTISLMLLSMLSVLAFLLLPYLGISVGKVFSFEGGVNLLFPLFFACGVWLVFRLCRLDLPRIPPGDLLIPMRLVVQNTYHFLRQLIAYRYQQVVIALQGWLRRKVSDMYNLRTPEVIENALRRHVVSVFLVLSVCFVIMINLLQ